MAPQTSSNAATTDYGLEDDKTQQKPSTSPKSIVIDDRYGLETAPEAGTPAAATMPSLQERNRAKVLNASPTQFEIDRGAAQPKEQRNFDRQATAFDLGAATGASGLPATQHPIVDAGKADANKSFGDKMKDGATNFFGPVVPIAKMGYDLYDQWAHGGPKDAQGKDVPEDEEDKAERHAGVIGQVAGMGAVGVLGEGVERGIPKVRSLAPGPAVAPGLSDIATENLNNAGREGRVGNEKLFRAVEPTGGKTGFRESLATALPDLKEIELKNPIGQSGTAGGIVNPDFRLRQTVTNIDQHLDNLWNEQRAPQIERNKTSNTTARNDLGLNEDQLKAVETRMGEKIPEHLPLGEADSLLKKVNAFLRRSEALTPEGKALAQEISPTLDAFDTMKGRLHERINDTLQKAGEPGITEFNRRYGALSDVRDAIRSKMNPVEAARLLDQIKVFGSPTGHSITERLHIKASPGRNIQKGLERIAGSDLETHPAYQPPAPVVSPNTNPALPQVGGPQAPYGENVRGGGPGNNGLWATRVPFENSPESVWHKTGNEPAIGHVGMWGPEPPIGPPSKPPLSAQSAEYEQHLREQDPAWQARQPGERPPQVGPIGKVEVTRPQPAPPTPEESSTILPGRAATATRGLLPENKEVPNTMSPAVPEEFRREYVGPTDFNERSRLGARGDQGVRGPVLIHDPAPAPTFPRTPAGRPALGGPIGGVEDVPRGTNGPHEIFGGNRAAEIAAVEPDLAAKEQRRQDTTRSAMRGAADAFESHPAKQVPQIAAAKPTGDVGSIAEREQKGATTEFKNGENLVGAAHNTVVLRDAAGKEIGNALLTDTAENGKRGLRVSVSQIDEANRGKGFGKKMYNDIVDHAKEKGYDYVESDKKRTQDADRVWEGLKREGKPVRLEKGRYVLDVKDAGKTGTANDRPQVEYKPSEKVTTSSKKAKDLGKEFQSHEDRTVGESMQKILDDKDASTEEKDRARQYFKDNPKVGGPTEEEKATPTAAERVAARGPKPAGKVGNIGKVNPGDVIRNRAGISRRSMLSEFPLTDRYRVERLGDQLFAVEPGPNGVENRVSFKEGEPKEDIHKRLDDQAQMRKKFFEDREREKGQKTVDEF